MQNYNDFGTVYRTQLVNAISEVLITYKDVSRRISTYKSSYPDSKPGGCRPRLAIGHAAPIDPDVEEPIPPSVQPHVQAVADHRIAAEEGDRRQDQRRQTAPSRHNVHRQDGRHQYGQREINLGRLVHAPGIGMHIKIDVGAWP